MFFSVLTLDPGLFAIVAGYCYYQLSVSLSFSLLSFSLRLLILTHFRESPEAENLFPPIFSPWSILSPFPVQVPCHSVPSVPPLHPVHHHHPHHHLDCQWRTGQPYSSLLHHSTLWVRYHLVFKNTPRTGVAQAAVTECCP